MSNTAESSSGLELGDGKPNNSLGTSIGKPLVDAASTGVTIRRPMQTPIRKLPHRARQRLFRFIADPDCSR
jgi:hypothetical protein